MKHNFNANLRTSLKGLFGMSLLSLFMIFSACQKNEAGAGHFELKDNPRDINVPSQGVSQTFTIQAAGFWKVEPLRNNSWLKIESQEGHGDGTFTVTIARNATLEARESVLTFVMNGRVQNEVLKIVQDAGNSENSGNYLNLDGLSQLELPEGGFHGRYTVRSTGDWKIEVPPGADWLRIEPMEGRFDMGVNVSVDVNTTPDMRTTGLTLYLNGEPMPVTVDVRQEGMEVVLFEDFNWLNYGSAIFNTTTGETRFSNWSADQLAKGWTSTINPVSGGGNYASTYARQGFLKLGRTDFGGDIVSPKFSSIEGVKNVQVSFKSVLYMNASGGLDHNLLKVGVKGPGTVSVSEFYIDNKPDFVNDPNCTETWKKPEAIKTFTIEGATAETQVWFLAGDFDIRAATGWPKNLNRIFLDDVLVTVIK